MKTFTAVASAVATTLLAAAPAFAQSTVTLDFEGATGYSNPIDGFYSGGTDSLGQSGPNYGISFTNAAALSNDPVGPYYSNAPSPVTVMYALDSSAVMNVASGFANLLSFEYSSLDAQANAVNLYSGLNATGTLLASFSLLGNATAGCTDTAYCNFDLATIAFSGIAYSASFGGGAPNVLFDNVALAPIPEPSTYALLAGGLVAVALVRRRRAK